MLLQLIEYRKENAMRVKEKDGTNIEVKLGDFEELKEILSELILETKEQREDFKLFEKITKLFSKQTLEGQEACIQALIETYRNNLVDACKDKCDKCKKEELKEDANS